MNTTALKRENSFYRGETMNIMPKAARLFSNTGIQSHILKGWMPSERFIGPDTNIVAFGSCFASNIGRYLANLGFDVATKREGRTHVQQVSDGLVNVHAIAQQFEWAWENRVPDVQLWHGWDAQEYGYDEELRLETKRLFDQADVFILTFGLSEIWYDEPTGEVFWRAVPNDRVDLTRHKFRVATHDETVERLQRIYDLIRKHRPQAAIIFTLSPVGLAATFRGVSCVTANSVSKARLRSAIDTVHAAAKDPNFYYFPSYEIVLTAFRTPFATDLRHPLAHVIEANMKSFERYFCTTPLSEEEYLLAMDDALQADLVITVGSDEEAKALAQEGFGKMKERRGAPSVDRSLARRRWLDAKNSRLAQEALAKEEVRSAKAAARANDRQARIDERARAMADRQALLAREKADREALLAARRLAAGIKPDDAARGLDSRLQRIAQREADRQSRIEERERARQTRLEEMAVRRKEAEEADARWAARPLRVKAFHAFKGSRPVQGLKRFLQIGR